MIIDGPPSSGLLYECVKNLALSGVGRIVLLDRSSSSLSESKSSCDDSESEYEDELESDIIHYHNPTMDDLGNAYMLGAQKEWELINPNSYSNNKRNSNPIDLTPIQLLKEYIIRLNPGIQVDILALGNDNLSFSTIAKRTEILKEELLKHKNPVFLCIDRPQSVQIIWNTICHSMGGMKDQSKNTNKNENLLLPFVSLETAGVYGRLFCDFGNNFYVVDEDGETPKSTLIQKVVPIQQKQQQHHHQQQDDNDMLPSNLEKDFNHKTILKVKCVEGESHDVSKGDWIQFDACSGEFFEVLYIQNPTSFTIQYIPKSNELHMDTNVHGANQQHQQQANEISLCTLLKQLNGESTSSSSTTISFSRIKIPKKINFLSFKEALQQYQKTDDQKTNDLDIFAASDLDKSFDTNRRSAIMSSFMALEKFVNIYGYLPSNSKRKKRIKKNKMSISTENCKEEEEEVDDINVFLDLAQATPKFGQSSSSSSSFNESWNQIVKTFGKCAKGKFTPVQALYAALGAQEALKAATGLYNPVKQFILYDCDEILSEGAATATATQKLSSSSTMQEVPLPKGISYILGKSMSKALSSQRIFVVGSGAIGCEILKNLAAMGAGLNNGSGCIHVTDMDTIEKSNLSRQLLFRDADVGEFKSVAAKSSIQRLNPNVNLVAHTTKVGDNHENHMTMPNDDIAGTKAVTSFDHTFWSHGIDMVLNALDNVEARLYIDSQCVTNKKGLIDAGTLGPKGNVQVVVPNQSESYGSSVDPPEPAIPVCTLKNFPYEISHTIQWGRDLFDGLYNRRPTQFNAFREAMSSMNTSEYADSLIKTFGEDASIDAANEISQDYSDIIEEENCLGNQSRTEILREASLKWAAQLAKKLFDENIRALLSQHPKDSFDDEGQPFWAGTRKVPKPLVFRAKMQRIDGTIEDSVNQHLIEFVRFGARLRMENFLSDSFGNDSTFLSDVTEESAETALLKVFSAAEDGNHSCIANQHENNSIRLRVVKTLTSLCARNSTKLNPIEFEKDDDSNGHVAFITAASNLRAICYGISPVDGMETRRVAGRIVPAMITTTGFVSALSCIEMIKLLQNRSLNLYRNAFINLALPFFAFTAPLPPEGRRGLGGEAYTIWDRIIIKESEKSSSAGGLTLRKFIKRIEKKTRGHSSISTEVCSISFGPYMLYANFLHEGDDSLLDTSIIALVKEALISDDDNLDLDDDMHALNIENLADVEKQELRLIDQKPFIDLSVSVEDLSTNEEVELPPVRFVKWNQGIRYNVTFICRHHSEV